MKNMSTWLLSFFMVMFAGFRVIVTITNQQGSPLAGATVKAIQLAVVSLRNWKVVVIV